MAKKFKEIVQTIKKTNRKIALKLAKTIWWLHAT
jgi:hypothetical protein